MQRSVELAKHRIKGFQQMVEAFACRSGARAWLWLGGATVLAYAALYAAKALGWAAELPA